MNIKYIDPGAGDILWKLLWTSQPELWAHNKALGGIVKDVILSTNPEDTAAKIVNVILRRHRSCEKEVEPSEQQRRSAMEDIRQRCKNQNMPLSILQRSGETLAHIHSLQHNAFAGDSVPFWLQVWLSNFFTLPWMHDVKHEDIQTLESLGGLAQQPLAWLHYLFDAKHKHTPLRDINLIMQYDGMNEYLCENRDYLIDVAWPEFSAAGKLAFLKIVVDKGLQSEFVSLFYLALSIPSGLIQQLVFSQMSSFDLDEVRRKVIAGCGDDCKQVRMASIQIVTRALGREAHSLLMERKTVELDADVFYWLNDALYQLGEDQLYPKAELEAPSVPDTVFEHKVNPDAVDQLELAIKSEQAKAHNEKLDAFQRSCGQKCAHLTRSDAQAYVEMLNGGDHFGFGITAFFRHYELNARKDMGLVNICRMMEAKNKSYNYQLKLDIGTFFSWSLKHPTMISDIRMVDEICQKLGWAETGLFDLCLHTGDYEAKNYFSTDALWPFFLENIDLLKAKFGPDPVLAHNPDKIDAVVGILECFPAIPKIMHFPLLDIALGVKKTHRDRTQRLLAKTPHIVSKVITALHSTDNKDEVIVAAQWLQNMGSTEAIPVLQQKLGEEKREVVKAVLLSALKALGADLTELLTPDNIYADAIKALGKDSKKFPKTLMWLSVDEIPRLYYSTGQRLAPEVVAWWLSLAFKLKDPASELMQAYIGLLDKPSRDQLGGFIMSAFVARDIRQYSETELLQKVDSESFALYQSWQSSDSRYLKQRSHSDAVGQLTEQYSGEFLHSAIKEKGILALCCLASAGALLAPIREMMRSYYQRWPQILAIVQSMAINDDPKIVQFLLSTAQAYRTKKVQEQAAVLVVGLAKQLSWSPQQLADRTLTAAGCDQQGGFSLDFGARKFTIKLSSSLKLELFNADGKPLKSLPTAAKKDDTVLVKESKQYLAQCKKELKSGVGQASQSYYQAMCDQYQWSYCDWQRDILAHPVAQKLAQRLIWVQVKGGETCVWVGTQAIGKDLGINSTLTLFHSALAESYWSDAALRNTSIEQLRIFLEKCAFKALFEQVDRMDVIAGLSSAQTEIRGFRGYLSDALIFKGAFKKLGYQAEAAEDGGSFYSYHKDFKYNNLRVMISFTGSYFPEVGIPAALKEMYFVALDKPFAQTPLPLAELPAVILSEAYSNLESVAAKCKGGYDSRWEQKTRY